MIYLASCYSDELEAVREWRYKAACRATAILLLQGKVVFSPIVHSHALLAHGAPNTWEFWSAIDFEYLTKCDEFCVLMLEGWKESVGVTQEIAWAKQLALPISYLDPVTCEVVECA